MMESFITLFHSTAKRHEKSMHSSRPEVVSVTVAIDGRQAGQFPMSTAQPKRLRYPLKQPAAYLELSAQTANGASVAMRLRLE